MAASSLAVPLAKNIIHLPNRFQADALIVASGEEEVQEAFAEANKQLQEVQLARHSVQAALEAKEDELKKALLQARERASEELDGIAATEALVKGKRSRAACALRELCAWPKLLSSPIGQVPWPLIGEYLLQEEVVCVLAATSPLIHSLTTCEAAGLFRLTMLELGHLRDLEYVFGVSHRSAHHGMQDSTTRSCKLAESMLSTIHLPSLRVLDLGQDSFALPLRDEVLKQLAAKKDSQGFCLRNLQECKLSTCRGSSKCAVDIISGAPLVVLSLRSSANQYISDLLTGSVCDCTHQSVPYKTVSHCWQLLSTLEVLCLRLNALGNPSARPKFPLCDAFPQLKFLEVHGMDAAPDALRQLLVAAPKLKWLNLWIRFAGKTTESQGLLKTFADFAISNAVSFARWPARNLSYTDAIDLRRCLQHALIFEAERTSICIADHIPDCLDVMTRDYAEEFGSRLLRDTVGLKLFRYSFSGLAPRRSHYEHCHANYAECDCSTCRWLHSRWHNLVPADKDLCRQALSRLEEACLADVLATFDTKTEDLKDRFVKLLHEKAIPEDRFHEMTFKNRYDAIMNPTAWNPTSFQTERISRSDFPVTLWRKKDGLGSWMAIKKLGYTSSLKGIFPGDPVAYHWQLKAMHKQCCEISPPPYSSDFTSDEDEEEEDDGNEYGEDF